MSEPLNNKVTIIWDGDDCGVYSNGFIPFTKEHPKTSALLLAGKFKSAVEGLFEWNITSRIDGKNIKLGCGHRGFNYYKKGKETKCKGCLKLHQFADLFIHENVQVSIQKNVQDVEKGEDTNIGIGEPISVVHDDNTLRPSISGDGEGMDLGKQNQKELSPSSPSNALDNQFLICCTLRLDVNCPAEEYLKQLEELVRLAKEGVDEK